MEKVSRVVFDRGYTEWDEGLTAMNVDCATMTPDSTSEYISHIRHNSIPFYRRKSGESANQPIGVSPQLAAASEESSHTSAGLTRTLVDDNHLSSVTIDAVTEAAQAVVNAVYGQAALSASSERTVTTNSNSWTSSAAATEVPNNAYPANSMMSSALSNSCTVASLANSGLLRTSTAGVESSPSSSSHSVSVVTSSRLSLTESVGHCVERPLAVGSVRIVGNCVAPTASSLSNHSSALRGLGPACASTAVSFNSAPLLKSAGSAIHRMESVPRDSHESTDMPAVVMEVT